MSLPGSGRLKAFLGIFTAIVLLHVIVIAMTVPDSEPSEPVTTPAAEKTVQEKAPAQEPGFWERLFGGKKAEKKQKNTAQIPPKPVPRYRYRKPSADKNFGKPFSFMYARRGTLPETLVPGDTARTAILVDMNTRRVLWEKNSHQAVPIASMSKMMTILLTMEHLEKNPSLSLTSPVRISKNVLKLPSRQGIVWLDPRETFPLSDLLKCAAIKSANDAALQLALTVAGSEQKFVAIMNQRAMSLGMKNTRFINAHGLPNKKRDQSLSSAHDMVKLGEQMLEYPCIMDYFQTLSTSIREGGKRTIIANTNRLIRKNHANAEGMKTGYTRKAGFCLTFSVKRDNRRLMGCVTGFKTARARDAFCKRLIDWGFAGCPDKAPAKKKPAKRTKRRKADAQIRKNLMVPGHVLQYHAA